MGAIVNVGDVKSGDANVEDALYALLHRRDARAAFARGELACEELRAIDREQLEAMARLVRDTVFTRSQLGCGTLADAFARTIAAWHAAHPAATLDDLAADFLESPSFDAHAADGPCIEEAFFRFAEATNIGEAATRAEEAAEAIVKTLAVCEEPAFAVPELVRRAPRGWLAIAPGPRLVAAVDGRFMRGAITPLLADLLTCDRTDDVAARHGLSAEELRATTAELARLGLR